jgi:hypothetical protein
MSAPYLGHEDMRTKIVMATKHSKRPRKVNEILEDACICADAGVPASKSYTSKRIAENLEEIWGTRQCGDRSIAWLKDWLPSDQCICGGSGPQIDIGSESRLPRNVLTYSTVVDYSVGIQCVD